MPNSNRLQHQLGEVARPLQRASLSPGHRLLQGVLTADERGRHATGWQVAAGARYRGSARVLGVQESTVEVTTGEDVLVDAKGGFFNYQPFTVAEPAIRRS